MGSGAMTVISADRIVVAERWHLLVFTLLFR